MNQILDYPVAATAADEAVPFAPARTALHRAWWGVVARFLIHGLVISTWVSRIPTIKAVLHLGDGVFGLTLLGTAVGSIIAIPLCGWIVAHYGSRRACTWTSIGLCASLVLPALAVNAATLFAALFVFGAMAGSNDVAMNAQAVSVEKRIGGPTMSRFHAMFSLGGIFGAAAGGWIASQLVPSIAHFLIAAAIFLAFSVSTAPLITSETTAEKSPAVPAPAARLQIRRLPKALMALGAIGFCIFLSEGAIADWTAVYLKQVLGAGPGLAAAGYAVFSAAMAVFRLIGDFITTRLGPAWTIRAGAILAAAGLTSALLVHSPYWALPGFALVGAGFSSIIPLVFAAGGRIKSVSEGAGVAAVSGLGYIGFLIGPPLIGFLSQLTSLRVGLSLLVLLTATSAALVKKELWGGL